ncbi:regulator of microtubule dynamics protein 1-like [Tubulanus polymorphus]|uniref:regulator of microtubule dynamics protein 1-like n=1 Tax=Tubulanus polymorphus TaxID=672921 RepID=UPI003DA6146E
MAAQTIRQILKYKRIFHGFKDQILRRNFQKYQGYIILQRMALIDKFSPYFTRYPLLLPCFVVHAAFGFGGSTKKVESEGEKEQKIIDNADQLYHDNENSKLYEFLLEHKDSKNVEIVWRLSRATYDKGQEAEDLNEKKRLHYEAYEYIQKALELDDKCFAVHKWMGILLDVVGEHEGTRKRIENSFLVKKHFQKAVELNPTDATSVYSLGYWHFLFADMAWYERKIAAIVFTSPPTSTYKEALEYFEKAEEIDPNFYSMNLLMIGKCYLRLKNKERAKEFFIKAKNYPVQSLDDKKAHQEAVDLLKKV